MVHPNKGFKGEERRTEDMGDDSGLVNSTVKVKSCGSMS